MEVFRIEDRTGNVLPTPLQTYVPIGAADDIDGMSITADGTHGAVVDGASLVHFFSSNLATGTVTILPATINVSTFGGDGDSVASLPGGDEVVVLAGTTSGHPLISGVLSGKPVVAESIPAGNPGQEYDGLVISADGKVMLARSNTGRLLDVYSVTPVTPHAGPLGGTVAFSFKLVKTFTNFPASTSPDGRGGMALSPTDSSRAVVVGPNGYISLITGLPHSPAVHTGPKLPSTASAVAISRDGKFALAAISGLVVLSGVNTGTLVQAGAVYSPRFPTPAGNCQLSSPSTLGVMTDGMYVVTIQDCGLTKSATKVGSGVLLTIPFSGGALGAPLGRLDYIVTPDDDQLLTH